jgi:hypothetical protein
VFFSVEALEITESIEPEGAFQRFRLLALVAAFASDVTRPEEGAGEFHEHAATLRR